MKRKIKNIVINSLMHFIMLIMGYKAMAEGTKQLMPNSSAFGFVQFNDVGRPFALTTNTDSLYRLYFHISSTTEKVFFGFKKHSSSSATSGTFRIKNPSGTIVYAQTTIPISGTGYISSYAAATAGPKINSLPATGYTPFSFTPTSTGDFYMEFSSASNANFRFEFLDITVTTSANVPILGRLWAYAWDLSTASGTNAFTGSFYVYTDEGYVSRINLNGIQPFGFVVSCNNSGTQNTSDPVVNRRSISGNSTRPQFKIFFNDPDISVYPSSTVPSLTSPITIVSGSITYGNIVRFTAGVSAPGTIQIILSMNGVSGYQAGTEDVVIASNVISGTNFFDWDGRNAFGNFPAVGTQVEISTGFSSGITHLPIYDPETNPSGFIVDRIRPGSGSAPIRWDDNNLAGTVNVSGGSGSSHVWPANFGNNMTVNTWWNGYEVENSDQFTVSVMGIIPLAVDLIEFTASLGEDGFPLIEWETVSETYNNYFVVESKYDGDLLFSPLGVVSANYADGNKEYSFEDVGAKEGNIYYRLVSVDKNGLRNIESNPVRIQMKSKSSQFEIYPTACAGGELFLNFNQKDLKEIHVHIRNQRGYEVFSQDVLPDSYTSKAVIYLPSLPEGIYFVEAFVLTEKYVQKLLIRQVL